MENIRINNLLLLESDFKRISNVVFSDEVISEVTIETEISNPENNVVNVIETVTLVQKYQGQEQVSIKAKMVGVFDCDDVDNYEEFGRINGAAIIFPYIREHITNLSTKAGIGTIVMPPVNFENSVRQ